MSGSSNMAPTKANSSLKLPRGLLSLNGTPLPPGARLPSLRGPKDLALPGSPTKTKRTFAANVTAPGRAPTQKGADRPAKDRDAAGGSHHQGGSHQPDWGHPFQRLPHRGSPCLIQREGATFAHGVDSHTKTTAGFASWNSSGPGLGHMEKLKLHHPSGTTTSSISEQKAEDKKKLDLLLRRDFIDDGPAETSWLNPTTLPLPLPAGSAVEQKPSVKLEVPFVKQEPMEEPVVAKPAPSTALRHLALVDLLTDPNLPDIGQLLFFQLPDCLPSLNTPYEQPIRKGAPRRQNHSFRKTKEEPGKLKIKLPHFPEGYVGKLQVLKSGRIRLVLGAVALNVDLGTQITFRQDLMSLRLPEIGGAHAYNLGQIKHKLICLPDMEQLLTASLGAQCHEPENS